MKKNGFIDLGFAKVDTDRLRRRGFPEVVLAQGKAPDQIKAIARTIIKKRQPLLLTRLENRVFRYLKKSFPRLIYKPLARIAGARQSLG